MTHWNIDEYFCDLQAGKRLSQRLHKKLWVLHTDTFRQPNRDIHVNLIWRTMFHDKQFLGLTYTGPSMKVVLYKYIIDLARML